MGGFVFRRSFKKYLKSYWYRIGICFLLGLAGVMAIFPISSEISFSYLAIGRRFFQAGALPKIDPFIYPIPNYPLEVYPEWLSHVLSYGIYKLGGWNALIVVKAWLVLLIGFTPLYFAKRIGFRSPLTLLLVTLALRAGCHRFIERTSLISDLLIAVVIAIVLSERKRAGRLRYVLPFIFLAWVNLHPGYILGLGILGLALLGDLPEWRKAKFQSFGRCALASGIACLINQGHDAEGRAVLVGERFAVHPKAEEGERVHGFVHA